MIKNHIEVHNPKFTDFDMEKPSRVNTRKIKPLEFTSKEIEENMKEFLEWILDQKSNNPEFSKKSGLDSLAQYK